jgi:hypothetical protein
MESIVFTYSLQVKVRSSQNHLTFRLTHEHSFSLHEAKVNTTYQEFLHRYHYLQQNATHLFNPNSMTSCKHILPKEVYSKS